MRLLDGMTVRDLINDLHELKQQGYGDTMVVFACDYGDYRHTQQALPVICTETGSVESTGYSLSGYKVSDDDTDDEEVFEEVVILS